MLHEFTLSRGRAMINFTLKYCDTKQKLLNSYGFRRVVDSFIKQFLKKEEIVIFDYYIEHFGSEDNLVDTANKAKDYLFTILDSDSVQYKTISKIKFKKR